GHLAQSAQRELPEQPRQRPLSIRQHPRDRRYADLAVRAAAAAPPLARAVPARELVDGVSACRVRGRSVRILVARRGRYARAQARAASRRRGRKRLNRMDAIKVNRLVKNYGPTVGVEDLSFSVPAGTMFGFLGPNGSGKSTTIGCMTGLLDPTSGDVELLGQRFTASSADLKRRIGVMPETLGLFEP